MASVAAVLAAALLGFHATAALAGRVSPAVETVPRPDSSRERTIPEGRYLYRFAWNGIPSAEGEVVVSVERDGEQLYYSLKGTARTSKIVDIFWKYRARAVAVADALSGRASKIHVAEQQNKKVKESETVFSYESSEAYYTRWKKGEMRRKTIRLDDNTIDPVYLGLIICQRPLKVGDYGAFKVLVGDDPYDLEYRVTGRDRITATKRDFDALRIEPRFYKISRKKKKKPPKVKRMTLWLSESEPRIPLKMKSRTFIGYVTAELVRSVPAGVESGKEPPSAS